MSDQQNLVGPSEIETLKMELEWSANHGRELLRNLKVLYTALSNGVAYFSPTKTNHDLDSNQCKYNALIAMLRGLMSNLEAEFEFQMMFKQNAQIAWQSIDTGLYTLQRQSKNEIPIPTHKNEPRVVQSNEVVHEDDVNNIDEAIGSIIDSSAIVQDIITKWFASDQEKPAFRVNVEVIDKDNKPIVLNGIDINSLVAKHAERVIKSYDEEKRCHCKNDCEHPCDDEECHDDECHCDEDGDCHCEHCECHCDEETE